MDVTEFRYEFSTMDKSRGYGNSEEGGQNCIHTKLRAKTGNPYSYQGKTALQIP